MKKVSLFLVLLALLACVLTASAQKLEGLTLLPDGSDMLKYGNPDIDLAADELRPSGARQSAQSETQVYF